jgi:hypothetical protein
MDSVHGIAVLPSADDAGEALDGASRWAATVAVSSITVETAPTTAAPRALDVTHVSPVSAPAARTSGPRGGISAPKAWRAPDGTIRRPPPAAAMTHRWYRDESVRVLWDLIDSGKRPVVVTADEKTARKVARSLVRTHVRPRVDAERRAKWAAEHSAATAAVHAWEGAAWQTSHVPLTPGGVQRNPEDVARATSRALVSGLPAEPTPSILRFCEPTSAPHITERPDTRAMRFLLHSLAHKDKRSLPSLFCEWENGIPTTPLSSAAHSCEWCGLQCAHSANSGHRCPALARIQNGASPAPEWLAFAEAKRAHEAARDGVRALKAWAKARADHARAELHALDMLALPLDAAQCPDDASAAIVAELQDALRRAENALDACNALADKARETLASTAVAFCQEWHAANNTALPAWFVHVTDYAGRLAALGTARLALVRVVRARASADALSTPVAAVHCTAARGGFDLYLPAEAARDGRRVLRPGDASGYVATLAAATPRHTAPPAHKPAKRPPAPADDNRLPNGAKIARVIGPDTAPRGVWGDSRGGAPWGAASPARHPDTPWVPEAPFRPGLDAPSIPAASPGLPRPSRVCEPVRAHWLPAGARWVMLRGYRPARRPPTL